MNRYRKRMWADGLAAGLVGYAIVAAFFTVWNALAGRSPFYTASLLGEAVFFGLRDPALATVDAGAVLAFNGVHLLAFLAFGFFAAWLVYETELHPEFWYVAFFLFLGATVLSYGAVLAVTILVGNILSPWLVVASSLLGAAGMAVYLTASHRPMLRRLRGAGDGPAAPAA